MQISFFLSFFISILLVWVGIMVETPLTTTFEQFSFSNSLPQDSRVESLKKRSPKRQNSARRQQLPFDFARDKSSGQSKWGRDGWGFIGKPQYTAFLSDFAGRHGCAKELVACLSGPRGSDQVLSSTLRSQWQQQGLGQVHQPGLPDPSSLEVGSNLKHDLNWKTPSTWNFYLLLDFLTLPSLTANCHLAYLPICSEPEGNGEWGLMRALKLT